MFAKISRRQVAAHVTCLSVVKANIFTFQASKRSHALLPVDVKGKTKLLFTERPKLTNNASTHQRLSE